MAIEKDILLDETTFDLKFQNGDFVLENSDYFHIQNILIAEKGWYKQYPFLGANTQSQNKGIIDNVFLQKARLNLEADGFKVKKVAYSEGELIVEAER